MESKYYITADSFSSNCPDNWEEIAYSLNTYLEAIWNSMTEQEQEGFDDVVRDLWEDYCQHEGADCKPLDATRKRHEIIERIDALRSRYKAECEDVADMCKDDGYPSHGENWDLRCDGLWEEYYAPMISDLADLAGLPEQAPKAPPIWWRLP